MRPTLLTALLLAAPAAAWGQAPPGPEGPAPSPVAPALKPPKKADAGEFDIAFLDGSNVKVALLEASVVVNTRYGKLTVPVAELRKVELGFRYPEGIEARLDSAIQRLGAAAFPEREEAGRELLELKQYAGPALKRATTDPDAERQRRAATLLDSVRKLVPAERVDAKDFDTVETAEFVARGRLESASIKVRTKQFGEAVVRLGEVRQLRAAREVAPGNELALDAASYGKMNWQAWFDTGIDLAPNAPLDIVCTGTIDQWPQEAGRYTSGPGGNGNPAPNQQGNVRFLAANGPNGMNNPNGMGMRGGQGMVQSGAVVGRVGPAGQPFLVGASLKLPQAPGAGRLYLQIAPSHWGNDNLSGSYAVKVKTTAE